MEFNVNRIESLVSSYIGRKFEHKEGGFDCKGFVVEFLNAIGNPVKVLGLYPEAGFSDLQDFYKDWRKVKNMRAGDVLLFRNKRGNIYHIGVAVSAIKFIHNTKNGVLQSDLSDVWARRLAGVFRRDD